MKSHVSDYLDLTQSIYEDACDRCAVKASRRDLLTLRSRVEDEGVSFLTITLPKFGSDFEQCLELGFIDPKCFRSFRKHKRIPAFLRGMLGQVFDKETGRIIDNVKTTRPPEYIACLVDCVRQICHAFKKIKLPCTQKRVQKALQGYVDNEHALEMFSLSGEDSTAFSRVSSVLWDNIMVGLRLDDAIPRHGPRATAESYTTNQKYRFGRWHERLEPYFPLVDNAFSTSIGEFCFISNELNDVQYVPASAEQPVKVVQVPKTLKAPRIIAVEPACMQFAQQAIRGLLYDVLQSHKLTSGHINFDDQTVNQKHAMISSKDGLLATIDLSDASDRVPHDLALEMFSGNPELRDAIDACRSTSAKLPDGRKISPLRKFASMGSSLCFPVEAMYFYTICVMAMLNFRDLPVSHENCFSVSRDIYIYGDDIIVPVECTASVIDHLHKYNCKVNTDKTFYRGKFRESCGADCYDGIIVTPIYVRSEPPISRQQASNLISWTDTANLFFKKGYIRTSQLMFSRVEKYLGRLPSVHENSGVLGRHHHWDYRPPLKFNRRLQQLEMRCWIAQPVYRTDPLDGYAALWKSLSKLNQLKELDEPRDKWHLERTARFHAVTLKRGGVPVSYTGLPA